MIELNNTIINQNRFPDGTLHIKYDQAFSENEYIIKWKYENDKELFALICLVRHIKEHNSLAKINLFLPYLPNARQDRVKNPEDVFTLKYFCEIINSLEFDTVFVTDVHSNVGLTLLDRVKEIKPWGYIEKAIHKISE